MRRVARWPRDRATANGASRSKRVEGAIYKASTQLGQPESTIDLDEHSDD